MPHTRPKPVLLTILDGFGENPHAEHNAVAGARTPTLDMLKKQFPHGLINASELYVGLPTGQMGNSEVGHMNIGSGRVLMQDLPRIDQAIENETLATNPALLEFIATLKKSGGVCHLMGLLSPGGVHSHQSHMAYLARVIERAGIKVWIHAFLDGRDTPPQSALEYLAAFQKEYPKAQFATLSGRYYAMDRDNRWDRIQKVYDMMTDVSVRVHVSPSSKSQERNILRSEAGRFKDAASAIQNSYENKATDEFMLPALIGDYPGMKDSDGILMANFRADRARQILQAFLNPVFNGFPRARVISFAAALGMSEYSSKHNAWMKTLFSPAPLQNILGEIVAGNGMKQLRIAETEKYAHVTFFFNGGREEPFAGEERILVPSPQVATYDLQPEMSAYELTDKLVTAIESGAFDLIVANYANTDMVGHTGSLEAAVKAVETVDICLGRVWQAIEKKQGAMIVTADHGNCEEMFDDETHQPHTAHTLNLVPVILATSALAGKKLNIPEGKLADIAPTILKLLGLPQPAEMSGKSLL